MGQPNITRVLVPTDFSACAHAALEYAAFLALRFGAKVKVLHVWELPIVFGGVEAFVVNVPGTGAQTLADTMRVRAEKEMEEVLGRHRREGKVEVEGEVMMGSPVAAIVEAARDFDLVVMGTHGRGAISHALLGSIAERVVRKAPCPVLTVRQS